MHELSYTEKVFHTVLAAAEQANAEEVTMVRLRIGVMHGFVGDFVRRYWHILAKNSIAEQAEIVLETVPIRRRCPACDKVYETILDNPDSWKCPNCGNAAGDIVSGSEMEIVEIGIRTASESGPME